MNNRSKLFTEELARRNPDWEKIVAAHNAALASEREKHESCVAWEDHNETLEEAQQLREQLAAERERTKAAVEALKEIRGAGYTLTRQDGTNVIEATLAKIQI